MSTFDPRHFVSRDLQKTRKMFGVTAKTWKFLAAGAVLVVTMAFAANLAG